MDKKNNLVKWTIILVYTFRRLFDWLIDIVFCKVNRNVNYKPLNTVKEGFLKWSAIEIAQNIRTNVITSEKVVKSFIERIKEVNDTLNAVVDERFEEALKEAKQVDEFLLSTKQSQEEIEREKPFLGVPFTSKESTSAKGLAFTFGLASRKGIIGKDDADIVSNMKASGAILVAVTNIPELNLWCETRNNVYGQTLNPYDMKRTVGGSSGGESCIIAACGSPFGIGTDIGGSTRMPAYFCGIFGHKPTSGLISTRGLTFRTGQDKDTMVTPGTMTRYAKDITPFLKVLLGENVTALNLDKQVNLKDLKYYFIDSPNDLRVSPISNEIKNVIRKAAEHLSSITSTNPEKVTIEGFKYSLSLWRHEMTKEPGNFAEDLANREGEVCLLKEIPKLAFGKCQYTLPAIMRIIDLKVLPPTNAKWADEEIKKLKEDVVNLLGNNGILLFPSYPTEAPYHYTPFFRPYNFAYWAIFNVLKLPVTQVPMGLSKNGLPLGLQVVAGPYNDHLAIAVAKELETAFGGWVAPFVSK